MSVNKLAAAVIPARWSTYPKCPIIAVSTNVNNGIVKLDNIRGIEIYNIFLCISLFNLDDGKKFSTKVFNIQNFFKNYF